MAKIKAPDLYSTFDFIETGNKLDYKVTDKAGNMVGWIRKFCIDKRKVKKEKRGK